jgi:predicted nucleic acid-binding protein
MDAYLLDTCFLSKLYDQRRPDYAVVRAAALGLDAASPQYLSVVVLAELRYGLEAAELAGQNLTHIRHTIEQAATRQLIEVNRHTAQAYGEVKARLAAHWTDLSRKLPRWLEDWKDRVSSKSLQVDEGDLWLSHRRSNATTFSLRQTRVSPTASVRRCQICGWNSSESAPIRTVDLPV